MRDERVLDHPPEPPPPSIIRLCAVMTVVGAVLGPGAVFLSLLLDVFGALLAFVAVVVVGVYIGRSGLRSTQAWAPVVCVGVGAVLGGIALCGIMRESTDPLGRAMLAGYVFCSGIGNFLVCLISALVAIWRAPKPRVDWRFCERCGYDLRGNTSGRCPECGLIVPCVPRPMR